MPSSGGLWFVAQIVHHWPQSEISSGRCLDKDHMPRAWRCFPFSKMTNQIVPNCASLGTQTVCWSGAVGGSMVLRWRGWMEYKKSTWRRRGENRLLPLSEIGKVTRQQFFLAMIRIYWRMRDGRTITIVGSVVATTCNISAIILIRNVCCF